MTSTEQYRAIQAENESKLIEFEMHDLHRGYYIKTVGMQLQWCQPPGLFTLYYGVYEEISLCTTDVSYKVSWAKPVRHPSRRRRHAARCSTGGAEGTLTVCRSS